MKSPQAHEPDTAGSYNYASAYTWADWELPGISMTMDIDADDDDANCEMRLHESVVSDDGELAFDIWKQVEDDMALLSGMNSPPDCVSISSRLNDDDFLGKASVDVVDMDGNSDLSTSDDSEDDPSFNQKLEEAVQKLVESMRRSNETRRSLRLTSPAMQEYPRRGSVNGVISSVEESAEQLKSCLVKAREASQC